MNLYDLNILKQWFSDYTESFRTGNSGEQKNIDLKIDHSHQVCRIIVQLAEGLSLSREKVFLAEAIGLLHDIGRFPQYARYKTFRDNLSKNHGMLGAEVLTDEKVLAFLPVDERGLIIDAVKFHNAFAIPDLQNHEKTLCLRLVRDADKLDIWRIFLGFFEGSADDRASEAGLGLPDLPGYSENVISCIFSQKTVSLASLQSLNDFKLLQLSWVYDLNFSSSIRLLTEKDYVRKLSSLLPQTDDIKKLPDFLLGALQRKLQNNPHDTC